MINVRSGRRRRGVKPVACLGATRAVALTCLTALACRPPDDDGAIVVELERAWLDDGPPLYGMTNLFFEPAADFPTLDNATLPLVGRPEFADLYGRDTSRPIWVLRYPEPDGAFVYVVDTDADLDFTEESPLEFRALPRGTRVADLDIALDILRQARGEPSTDSLRYQIVTVEEGGWVYGRVGEYRRGTIVTGGRPFEVMLQPRSRNHPFHAPIGETRMFVDLNGDGLLDRTASVTRAGRRISSEEVSPGAPFRLGDRAVVVSELDSLGRRMVLMPSEVGVAPVTGFEAPGFTAHDQEGREHALASLRRDTVVMLEFWSVSCPFCEAVRPALNDMAEELSDQPLSWFILPYERDVAEVTSFLADHPTRARVLFADSTTWATYNPELITPRFFVIDRDGVVRFEARGAGAVAAVVAEASALARANR